MNNQSLVDSLLEVHLPEPGAFLAIAETLTRIGISGFRDGVKTLYQSCHILHKRGRYYVVHFKELFELDGRPQSCSEEDLARRNTVAALLEEWGLCDIISSVPRNPDGSIDKDRFETVPVAKIKIVKHSDKHNWKLVPKYTIGVKH